MRGISGLIFLTLTMAASLVSPVGANYLNGHVLQQSLNSRQKPYTLR